MIAAKGLNLRKLPSKDSEKITLMPYGTKVEVLAGPEQSDIWVDEILGGMAKVSTGEFTGYCFDGYLSRYPAPTADIDFEKYVELIRSSGKQTYYETINRDYGGYYAFEEAFILEGEHWIEAFLIAKQLCKLPPKFIYPELHDRTEISINNPDKAENVWEDVLTATEEMGELVSIVYSFRGEGSGQTVRITYNEEMRGLEIRRVSIAD